MKTDRKVDPVSSTSTTTTSRRHSHTHTPQNNTTTAATKTPTSNSRKRKAATNDRRTSNHFSDDAAESLTTTAADEHHVRFVKGSGDSKQHNKDADGAGREEEYVIAVSGRKKRVLVSPRPSQQQQRQSKQPQEDVDLDMNSDVDVVTVDEVVPRKKRSGARSSMTASVVPDPTPVSPVETVATVSPSKKASKRNAHTTATTVTSTTVSKTATDLAAEPCPASEESDKGYRNGTSTGAEHDPAPTTSTQPPTAKKSRKSLTAPSKTTTKASRSKNTAVAASQQAPTPTTPANITATSPPPSTTAAVAGSAPDAAPQKRVLPSRGGLLRDKNTIPIEPSLLEPPPVPAGEYVLYLADQQTFEHTTLDPKRVPPASYGATENVTPAESSASSTAQAQFTTSSTAPPSATTHIEVPIFKLCSITQFLQEEKKRKMQLLTKALAKAEADAAAEAKALLQSDLPSSATPRAVSTRQKHKAIVNNQHVSVQTAVPSFFSSSSAHAKKATTTNTTVGKIEGAVGSGGIGGSSSAAQEENLSDEVYEKRHRKQEMAEKKLKNREKEKLRHAMYQQQLVVEKLRHMEVNRLMPISAFRSLQKTIELEEQLKEASASLDNTHHHHSSNNISLAAAKIMQDEYYRRLLQEAEENLRRYEQLGLADSANISSAPAYSPFSRTKNRLISMTTGSDGQEQAPVSGYAGVSSDKKDRLSQHSHSDVLVANEGRRKRRKATDVHSDDAQDSTTPQRRRKKLSETPADATPTARKSQTKTAAPAAKPVVVVEPPRPPKPITTFIKPGSILASGSRKSYRVTLAFGEKVPSLDRVDFDLPMDLFGDIIRKRFGDAEPALQRMKDSGLMNKNQSARRATPGETDGAKDTHPAASESSSAPLPVSPPPSAT